jgi:hypothetical protein
VSEYEIRSAMATLTEIASHHSQYGLEDVEVEIMSITTETLSSLVTPHPDPPVEETIDLVMDADGIWSVA